MIERFSVKNYKALRDVTLDLTPVHVLIGPNDTGKTSILEAIAALCRSVDRPLAEAFEGPWRGTELVWQGLPNAEVSSTAVGKWQSRRFEYQFTCSFTGARDGRKVTVGQETIADYSGTQISLPSQDRASSYIYTSHEKIRSDPDFNDLCGLVRTALQHPQYYRFDPRRLALPVAPDAHRRFRLDQDGFGLALLLDDILGFDRAAFDALEMRFRTIFPKVCSIKLIAEHAYIARPDKNHVAVLNSADGKGIFFDMGIAGHLVPAAQMSDGMLLVLAYLAILYSPQPPSILLIEEPENGIHPKRLGDILQIVRTLVAEQGRTQVLLTTHSPYVVDLFEPNEVTLCQRGEDGSVVVQRLSDSPKVREQMTIFTLGEIWTAEGDEALSQPVAPAQEPAS